MNKQKWLDNNPFFHNKEEYEDFVDVMLEAKQENNLPVCLQHGEPEKLTVKDIKILSQMFTQDTGLSIDFELSTCKDCGELHCCLIVNPEEEY